VPSPFDGVIARGMVKKPKYRYASGKALTDAARAALTTIPATNTR
jgi:hypothetical protein